MAVQAVADEPTIISADAAEAGGLTVSVFASLEAAEPVWRELETRAVLTPYQRYDWIAAYCAAGFDVPETIAVLVLADRGTPIALLPLAVRRRLGVWQAHVVGMPISNADSIVYDPAHAQKLTPAALKAAFAALRRSGVKVDLVTFHTFVAQWQGHPNPLMGFPHAPAPNNLYLGVLEAGASPFIEQALPHKRRTNIRRSMRRLSETHGEIEVRAASTPEEIERVHAVFIAQRTKRFRQMGVENVFASAPFQTLFRTLALASLGETVPTFRYHALHAGDEILATSLGTSTATHYSQYINSTTDGPAAKYSLMGVMLSVLVDELRAEGVVSFDMGLGDFDYKTDWTEATTVYDSIVPVSPLGAAAAPLLRGARRFKRAIKQTPALWNAMRGLLALKARLREGRE